MSIEVEAYPRLYLQVFSVDLWDRHVLQGYGYHYIGKDDSDVIIKTWRPKGDYLDDLRSFFVGGSPELEDLNYLAVPQGRAISKLTKYNMTAESSGSITIRLNCLEQTRFSFFVSLFLVGVYSRSLQERRSWSGG